MMDDPNRIAQESSRILERLAATPFENCYPLSRRFSELPKRAGIYAITHRDQRFLYVGKTTNIQMRLRGGHKALAWAFIDRLNPDDVRVASVVVPYSLNRLLLQIEQRILIRTRPPYHDRIASEDP
ncbi:MAG: GIY-YIG nuclease family protein [Cyanobacteria bacterium J06638_22]